jgi:16S rRNA processing protein RimM
MDEDTSGSLICVGVVTGVRGLGGELRVKSFTEDPQAIQSYGSLLDETEKRTFDLKVVGQKKDALVVRIKGVEDRNAAEALKGLRLYVSRKSLPETEDDEYYFADLVGLRADLVEGGILGEVTGVFDYGAGAILEIATREKQTIMISFSRETVPEVHLSDGWIAVDPPEEILADGENGVTAPGETGGRK